MAEELERGGAAEASAGAASADPGGMTADTAASPSPEPRNDASNAGNTAPPADLAREAFRRLAKGERPQHVNRALFMGSGASKTAATAPDSTPADDDVPQPDATAQAGEWPEGMSEKDLNVLRRAHMDPETWAAIPPSNRTKILNNLRASQAAADRAFQQRQKQQKPGEADSSAAGASTQSDTDAQDVATRPGQREQDADPTQDSPSAAGRTAGGKDAAGNESNDLSAFLDSTDLETLDLIGGQELAGTMQRVIGRVAAHYEGRQTALLRGVEYLLDQHIGREFDAAAEALARQPGMEKLADHSDEGRQLRDALKKKALFLHRAAGDPQGYPLREAINDAAASLFKTNVHQTHQARLLRSRQESLAGSAERGTARTAAARPLSAAERNRAIFRNLQKGMSPDEARAAVDGS